MTEKILKGLTKEMIKASKTCSFSKEELQCIKDTAKVTLIKHDTGWSLYLYSRYYLGNSWNGSYLWNGSFSWDNKTEQGKMHIYSGFTGNPIGRSENSYTCTRPYGTDYKKEFKTVLEYMCKARGCSNAMTNDYIRFVKETGCLD